MQAEFKKKYIVILQSEISGNENKYIKALNEEGIEVKGISTLSFIYTNLEKLKSCLENSSDYSGIVFTSTRAVIAVSNVLNSNPCKAHLKNKLCFSVGESTAKEAFSLLNIETLGSDSGNSGNLCDVIIQNCTDSDKPLIFPCSNIRKDIIPDSLSSHNIQIKEIVCYETVPNAEFKEMWSNMIAKEGLPEVLVFFSPSGVKHCLDIIMNSYSNCTKPKFIALGTSTEKALKEHNIEKCKVAKKPNPESVLHAVKELIDI